MQQAKYSTGAKASLLAGIELGLGGLLQAFHIPLAGYILSLNQVFILSRFMVLKTEDSLLTPTKVSAIAAMMKPRTPVGKRLTPMLAIAMQGILFNMGTLCFGNNTMGRVVGGAFASVWGFIQPFLLYFLIFGMAFFNALSFWGNKLLFGHGEYLWWLVGGIVALKVLFAMSAAILGEALSPEVFGAYQQTMGQWSLHHMAMLEDSPPPCWTKRLWLSCRDLVKPLFLVCWALVLIFLIASSPDVVTAIWLGLRSALIAFILFFVIRSFPPSFKRKTAQGTHVPRSPLLISTASDLSDPPTM